MNTTEQENSLKEGDFVQSRYRAPWKGTVVELSGNADNGVAWVRQEVDRHGHPMRKQKWKLLHTSWLRKVERNDSL